MWPKNKLLSEVMFQGGCMVLKKVVWVALTVIGSSKSSMCTVTPLRMMKYELVINKKKKLNEIQDSFQSLSVYSCIARDVIIF